MHAQTHTAGAGPGPGPGFKSIASLTALHELFSLNRAVLHGYEGQT